jgi:large subunit ribosomal protein L19
MQATAVPMSDILSSLAAEQRKTDLPDVRPGDTVRLAVRVVEGNRERVQSYEGTVVRVRNGGLDRQITVRRISNGVGVERTFLMHSPRIERIELVRRGHARRAALYFLRARVGKAATLREKRKQ